MPCSDYREEHVGLGRLFISNIGGVAARLSLGLPFLGRWELGACVCLVPSPAFLARGELLNPLLPQSELIILHLFIGIPASDASDC